MQISERLVGKQKKGPNLATAPLMLHQCCFGNTTRSCMPMDNERVKLLQNSETEFIEQDSILKKRVVLRLQ